MSVPRASITRRLIAAVLLFESFAGIALVMTMAQREKRVQFQALDANLRATANALLGAVQEADTADETIQLDRRNLLLPSNAIFSVTDEKGQILGMQGTPPEIHSGDGDYLRTKMQGESFRFYTVRGDRIIDPGVVREVDHHIRVTYGLPEDHVWHEVIEEIRFLALATIGFLGLTAGFLAWVVRRYLSPIRTLAFEAEQINPANWKFKAPESSMRFVELHPLGQAIEKTVSRLQKSFDQQRQFTNDAAHELKTDVAIIKSSIQLTAMKRRTVEEYEDGLASGLNDIRRLEGTVKKMLTLARLEQSTVQEEGCLCNLAEIMQEAMDQMSPFAELKEIRLVPQGLGERSGVSMNKEDGLLLCSNVLMNAIQHSSPGATIEITASQDTKNAMLRVLDHGEGIIEGDLPFLFDPFYRGDESRSRKSGGTGLGLSICKAITDRCSGSISIANHKGGGALVVITVPLAHSKSEID